MVGTLVLMCAGSLYIVYAYIVGAFTLMYPGFFHTAVYRGPSYSCMLASCIYDYMRIYRGPQYLCITVRYWGAFILMYVGFLYTDLYWGLS